jgi:hypothetical protein
MKLLEVTKSELAKVKPNEKFLVRCFKGHEWNLISRSDILLLDTVFLNFIRSVDTDVDIIKKTSSGQQKYKKVTIGGVNDFSTRSKWY